MTINVNKDYRVRWDGHDNWLAEKLSEKDNWRPIGFHARPGWALRQIANLIYGSLELVVDLQGAVIELNKVYELIDAAVVE